MSATVTIKDKGAKALLERLSKAARQRTLTVGVHDDAGAAAHGATTIIDIATKHEFGLGVPQRSFIGAWADERQAEHEEHLRRMGEALIKGTITDPKIGFAQLGEAYVGEIQARIAGGIAPPNAPSTIARKGSSTPLIDKGVLRSSIAAKVDGQGAGAIVASAAKKSKSKKARKSKLKAKLARKLRQLKKSLKKLNRKLVKAAKGSKRDAKRALRNAKRKLVKQAKATLRAGRRVRREYERKGRRLKRSVVRSVSRASRSVSRAGRRARKAVFGRSRRRRR